MSPCFQKFLHYLLQLSCSCSVQRIPVGQSLLALSHRLCYFVFILSEYGLMGLESGGNIFFHIFHLLSLPRQLQRHSVASGLRWRGVGMGNGGGPGGQAL